MIAEHCSLSSICIFRYVEANHGSIFSTYVIQESPTEGKEDSIRIKGDSSSFRDNRPAVLCQYTDTKNIKILPQENTDFSEQDLSAAEKPDKYRPKLYRGLQLKIPRLEVPSRGGMHETSKDEVPEQSSKIELSNEDGYETGEDSYLTEEDFMFLKINLFDEDEEEKDEEPIPKEKIVQRINSHKDMKSYQLAKQLSSKWTTGAGPRIGCMRDYPSELQFRVLEQANLSPKDGSASSTPRSTSRFSMKDLTPTSVGRKH